MSRRALSLALSLLATALAAAGPGCSKAERPKNVLLFTLDTTRFDRISCYGSTRVRTPAIDSIATAGVRFEQAITAVPLTFPSHSSIMTGVYPIEHRIRDNASMRLLPSYETLAEVLRAHGFETAAFVSAVVLKSSQGISQGFDHFDDETPYVPKSGSKDPRRRGEETASRALDWFARRPDPGRPYFAWVHFFDPHDPYEPPEPFASQHGDSPIGQYDACVAYMDSCVGQVLSGLDKSRLLENTLIVAVADHGEGLNDHGEPNHGFFVYDETTRVPLLIAAPGVLQPGTVVTNGLARTIDIMPTVLEMLGVRAPIAVQGRSLLAAARGQGPAGNEALVECFYTAMSFGWSRLRALRTPTRKMIDVPTPEMYDINADPGETRNLADAGANAAELFAMKSRLRKLQEDFVHRGGDGDADAAQQAPSISSAQLAQLGYVAPAAVFSKTDPSKDLEPSGRDPKDRIKAYMAISAALNRIHSGGTAAIQIIEKIADQEPDNIVLQLLFVRTLKDLDQIDKADAVIEALASRHPDDPDILVKQGDISLKLGKPLVAAEKIRAGLARFVADGAPPTSPSLCPARLDLANALLQLGQRAEAEQEIGAIRSSTNDDPDWLLKIGNAYGGSEIWDAAALCFEQAVKKDATKVTAIANWGVSLVKLGRCDEAIRNLRQGLDKFPDDARLIATLGNALEQGNRVEEALRTYKTLSKMKPGDEAVGKKIRSLEERLRGSSPPEPPPSGNAPARDDGKPR